MTIMLWRIALFCFIFHTSRASVISGQIKLSSYNGFTVTNCAAQGLDYLDSNEQRCRSCPADQSPSITAFDGMGNSEYCQCQQGFYQRSLTCTTVGNFIIISCF